MFDELFSPGRKHTNEERKRLELTRVDLNDGDPGRGPIDLTSGKVVVRVPDQTPPDPTKGPETAATEPPEPAESLESAPEASAAPTTDPGRDPSHDSAPDPTAPSDDET
ncbi:DUF6191 domain-containing protein [Streptomyces sp. NBC_01003]|uniref:DUF6191 domain-containing protein n=1 Tax=Streptomyces sp. NBC_01003 TaxID=2903714 RepID=UPI003869A110|nr:DUF6191 domain-containing protein [Streptomyces sp. NBC_01003]